MATILGTLKSVQYTKMKMNKSYVIIVMEISICPGMSLCAISLK